MGRHHRAGGAERHRARRPRRAGGPGRQRHLDHRRSGRRPHRRHPAADRAHARVDAPRARVDVGIRHRPDRAAVRPDRLRPRRARAGGSVAAIVEDKDATDDQRRIDEINSGMYAFSAERLVACLGRITTDNAQGEEYLTDAIGLLRADGDVVSASLCADSDEVLGVNDRVQLAQAAALMRDRINESWMRQGVAILDPASTWLDVDVDLAGRRRDPTAGHDARADVGRHRRGRGPGHHPRLVRGRLGSRGHPHVGRARRHRGRRPRRPVHVPAARHGARQRHARRRLRRDQELDDRRRGEGAAPVLRRRRRRSASAPTSARPRSSSTTTGSTSTAPSWATTCGSAATPCSSLR